MPAEAYPQEMLADEEPRYLRRQKPLEIRRRKFGKRAWKTYSRISLTVSATLAAAWSLYAAGDFLLSSPRMALLHPEQISVTGNQYVARAGVLEVFTADRGRSILRIPLEDRRRRLAAIPWVERATVRRALPNRLEVEILERTPVAYLRQGTDLALIDLHGVVLEQPLAGDFHFPVVTGFDASMPREDRESRMKLFADFLQQIDLAGAGASDQVSEVDLASASDVRVIFDRLPGDPLAAIGDSSSEGSTIVHFGDRDFQSRYRELVENVAQWRAAAGRLESIDLRFSHEAVVNGERPAPAINAQDAAEKSSHKPAPTTANTTKHKTKARASGKATAQMPHRSANRPAGKARNKRVRKSRKVARRKASRGAGQKPVP